MKKLFFLVLLLSITSNSKATVSEFSEFFTPYQRVQSGYVCLHEHIMIAEFGIPLASILEGVFSKTMTLNQSLGGTSTYINTNMLASGSTAITYALNFDRYLSNVTDYSFTLDLAAFNTLNGNTVSGRQKTINIAKLAIISIIKTAEATHGASNFRVWIQFNNLPSQAGLSGQNVFTASADWPTWPYTSSSPVYNSYLSELISSSC